MKLIALIAINDGEPQLAVGSCCRTMMESIGENPVTFREEGKIVTSWVWQKTHDGYRTPPEPEEPKRKARISAKRLSKLEQRWANYTS